MSRLAQVGEPSRSAPKVSRLALFRSMLAALALSACADAPTAPPGLNGPNFEIKDGAHNNGAPHFFFTSPITRDPTPTGKFNGAAQPTVSVCEWTTTGCATIVAEFTVGKGTGGSSVKVDGSAERYFVNWNTGQCKTGACVLDPAKTYRIRVLIGGLEAGHADVDVVTSQAQARNVNTNEYIALVDGKVLQIRFRIEDGLSLRSPVANTNTFYPNSRRYRDAGAHPATGREGSATLQARALLGRDGSTVLELTTGALDVTGTAPGNIDHVELKLLAADNSVTLTQNYTDLAGGGSWTRSYVALPVHQAFQVQTNISGIDANRTNVVTVQGAIQRRPDLAALRLDAPAQVAANAPVRLTATVAERNGDVGATANCVLYVDGTEVDRADAIWVDAGSSVNCQFMTAFTGSGNKTATVRVETVVPGDDNVANNTASATVNVGQLNDFYFSAGAWDYDYQNYRYTYDASYTSSDNTFNYSYHSDFGTDGPYRFQGAAAWAWMSAAVAFPLAHVEFVHASGGIQLGNIAYDDLAADWTYAGSWDDTYSGHGTYSESSVDRYDLTAFGQVHFVVYSYAYSWTGGSGRPAGAYEYTQMSMDRYAGEISYYSRGAVSYIDTRRDENYVYSYNYSASYSFGTLAPYGSDYVITGAITGGGDGAPTYALTAAIPLSTYTQTFDGTPNCYTGSYLDYYFPRTITYHQCFARTGSYTMNSGWVSGTPITSP